MLPLKALCLPECHRWLPAWVRAATRSVRTRVASRRAKGSPLRWSLSGTSVMSGDRWAMTSRASRAVAVGGGPRDPGVAGQGPRIGAVLGPQHRGCLDPGGDGPLMGSGVVGAVVGGRPAVDGTRGGDGYVGSGTIGHPRGAFLASRFSWSKTTLTRGSACTPLRRTPPRPYLPFPAVPALRPRAPHPVRKPQCSNQSNLMAVEQVIVHLKNWRICHTDYRRPIDTFVTTVTAILGLHFLYH